MKTHKRILLGLLALTLVAASWACQAAIGEEDEPAPRPTLPVTTPLPGGFNPGERPQGEPVLIRGLINYTSPFFEASLSTGFVLLEDQAGFAARDEEFLFPLAGQVIGPVEKLEDGVLAYSLALPSVPQGTWLDVDNNNQADQGVQVFSIAYWSNTWGGPFLEERDGRGWSGSYVSTRVNSERDGEIEGGILLVWAPDDLQSFPTGYGEDNLLFTADDPTTSIAAGYSLVDLDQTPFAITKTPEPVIDLYEGAGSVKDFSDMDYLPAFDALFERVSREYPFTQDKQINWQALNDTYRPMVNRARTPTAFYEALLGFAQSIPDAHVGIAFDDTVAPRYFYERYAGSFGLTLAELSDGRVLVTKAAYGEAGERAGIQVGAEIVSWDGRPVGEAIEAVSPFLGPYSTPHAARLGKLQFLTRYPVGENVEVSYRNPGQETAQATLRAREEWDSLFDQLFAEDTLSLPVAASMLPGANLGYIKINTFHDDYYLMASLWERAIRQLNEAGIGGLVIDLRSNGGGSGGLAADFAGYFFAEEVEVYRSAYYNDLTGVFEFRDTPNTLSPGPLFFSGRVALLVGPNCISACEGFAHMVRLSSQAVVVGHTPSAGAFGEVGQGQYELPGGFSMQFPTGRPETPEGRLLIEGMGVVPDILVPVTEASALGAVDAVLEAAIQHLGVK